MADARIIGSGSCFVHRDHLNSILAETDAAEVAMLRQRFNTFGTRTVTYQGTGCTYEDRGYLGERQNDNAGLLDLNARWFNTATALFLTADDLDPVDTATAQRGDPVGWRDNPVGTNRYAYAGQDPINKSDPSGHCTNFENCLTGGRFSQPDGSISIESSIVLRLIVPGQVAWDNAQTSWANGDKTGAVVNTVAGVAEIGLTVGTLGTGKMALGVARATTREAVGAAEGEASVVFNNRWRTADGKFASPLGTGRAGVNAETAVWDAVDAKPGWSVVRGKVAVRDASGQLRYYDGAAISPRGRVIGLETKSGTAVRTPEQRLFDSTLNSNPSNVATGVGQSKGITVQRSTLIRVP